MPENPEILDANIPPEAGRENLALEPDWESERQAYARHIKQQRWTMIAAGVVAAAILFGGVWQIKSVIKIPLPPDAVGSGAETVVAAKTAEDLSLADTATLKSKDTDEDGLNDFEELYIYATSPYLADSDSDGVADKEEIDNNQDPNCPQGQTCFASSDKSGAISTANPNNVATGAPASLTVQQLRQLLSQSGQITASQVESLSDADIMELYQEALKQNPALVEQLKTLNTKTPAATTGSPAATGASTTLTIQEIKQSLLDVGISQEEIDQVDDDTLRSLYQKALEQAQQDSQNTTINP